MSRVTVVILIGAALLLSAPAFAVDGQILINQSTVMAAGGFPYTITQSGSYKLSGNLVVPNGSDGIVINANNVTVDLNGFTISGTTTCTGFGSSVVCSFLDLAIGIVASKSDSPPSNNVTVRNGSIVGFYEGLSLLGLGNLVEEIHVASNFGPGMQVSGGVVRRNTAFQNGNDGIDSTYSTVTENTMIGNFGYGLSITQGLYGSNTSFGNGSLGSLQVFADGAVSQNNNFCNASSC